MRLSMPSYMRAPPLVEIMTNGKAFSVAASMRRVSFSSSSLSKTMFEHLGHLVQRPSGISRFLDLLEPSFGFFTKLVSVAAVVGGGVTAGSTVSNPRVFLLNELVAIIQSIIHLTSA